MMLARRFALRYLFSTKSRSVINLIAVLSIVAVAVPVAAMVILLSVFNGFEHLIRLNGTAFDADLRLTPRTGVTFTVEQIDTAALRSIEGVESLSFVVEQSIMVAHNGRQAMTTLRGVEEDYRATLPLQEIVTSGESRLTLGDYNYLIIGNTMAYRLGIRTLLDAEIELYALRRGSFSSLLPMSGYTRREVEVGGIFEVDLATEEGYILAPMRIAEELLDYEGRRSALLIKCKKGTEERTKQALRECVGEEFLIEGREELNASMYRIIRYEKWGIFLIALMVLIVASFSVVGALSMLVIEKRQERHTLRALGANKQLIRSIFCHEGYLICLVGGALGMVVGIALTLLQQQFGLIEIPADSFLVKSYPVALEWGDLLLIAATFIPVGWVLVQLTVGNMIKDEEL